MVTYVAESLREIQGSSRFLAFFDECGDHSLTVIDRDFPLFLLATVIVEREDYVEEIMPRMNRLKLAHWDHEGVNLHSRIRARRNKVNKVNLLVGIGRG